MPMPQDRAAGLFLIGLGLFALWQLSDLSFGTLSQFGPGMLPGVLAGLVGILGGALFLRSFTSQGEQLGRWFFRGMFILGAAIAFGLVVRPFGLIVAGPTVVVIGALASSESRFGEVVIFAAALTLFSIGLFRYLLGLPIPVAPWLLGY